MTLGGWIVMIISVGTVSTLFAWCIYQVLTEKKIEDDGTSGQNVDPPSQ